MGFRGEALPSIAAVAQVELTTRMDGDEVGTRLTITASRVVAQEPVSCPVGSNFKVENLFYNVPVRRKFLKSNATELNNILTAFERIALVYPDIAFTLHSGDAELLNLRAGSLLQRITDVFGKHFAQDLLPVEVSTAMVHISGYVGKPEVARKKGAHQYLFANGRFMKHPYFHKAVLTAYERLIAEGTQPPYFLYLDVAPADIDVNIHPTKTEIKFENEQPVWQILAAAVKDAIGRFCEVPAIDFDTEGRPDIPVFNPTSPSSSSFTAPKVAYNPSYNPFKSSGSTTSVPPSPEIGLPSADTPSLCDESPSLSSVGSAAAVPQPSSLISDKSPLHYQYKARYIMTAVKSGLMIIDQHRASVRILYERYLAQTTDRAVLSQSVLFPEAVQFAPSELLLLRDSLPHLTKMGFELSDLGGGSFAVNAIPSDVEGSPVSLLRSIIADIAEGTKAPLTSHRERVALSMARVAAVPYGQVLSNDEMDSITNQLFACSNVNYTPDGRAILCILPQSDIEHLLG